MKKQDLLRKNIESHLIGNILTSNSKNAYAQTKKSFIGEKKGDKISYSLVEGLFLVEAKKMNLYSNKKILTEQEILKRFTRIDKKFPTKYAVYKILRKKNYIVKSALKFGAEFIVYEKGKKPGSSHSKWLVFTEHESNKTTWHEFASKNRVAHSTKKKLLLGIVDDQENVLFYEIGWIKI